MKNNELGDFTQHRFEERMTVVESVLADHFKQDGKEFLKDLGKFSGLDISNIQIKMDIDGMFYRMKNLSLNLKSDKIFHAEFKASGFCIAPDKITISINIPTMDGGYLPAVKTILHSPVALVGHITEKECKSENDIEKFRQYLNRQLSAMMFTFEKEKNKKSHS